jgi:Zn-dependent protease
VLAILALTCWIVILLLKEWVHARLAMRAELAGAEQCAVDAWRPLRHESPELTLGVPLFAFVLLGMGMTAPAVSVERLRFRKRWNETAVYLGGPLYHALLATLLALPFYYWPTLEGDGWALCAVLSLLNVQAFLISLIPWPPFDLYRAVAPWLPETMHYKISRGVATVMMVLTSYALTATCRGTTILMVATLKTTQLIGLTAITLYGYAIMFGDRWKSLLVVAALGALYVHLRRRR